MYLTVSNLPHFLISKNLVPAASVVSGRFAIVEAGRRNRNFKILRRGLPGMFVKQAKSTEFEAVSTLQREAAFYARVQRWGPYAPLRRIMPEMVYYDAARHALIIDAIEGAESLAEYYLRQGAFPREAARATGEGVALLHSFGGPMSTDETLRPLMLRQVPWAMQMDMTGPGFLQKLGSAGAHLAAAMAAYPALQPMLSALRHEWRQDSLIHGDMKWENCLVSDGQPLKFRVVDWELADIGDGAWDVATIFKEYLVACLLSGAPGTPLHSMEELRPAIREFWVAYAGARGLAGDQLRDYRDRSIRFTAARMVVAVLEYLHSSPQAGPLANGMLQTALSILTEPGRAAVELLGFPA